MSKVKLFDFNRFAKFGQVLVNPADIYGVTPWKHDPGNDVYYGEGDAAGTTMTIQEIEDEINRALEATRDAHVKHEIEALAALKKLEEEIHKNATQDAFKMNDFYPKGEN